MATTCRSSNARHTSATVRQLPRNILAAAIRHLDALSRLPLAMQEQIKLLQQKYGDDGPDDSDDRGDHIARKGSWTKGGRERTVPITTPEQRAVLDDARCLAGAGSLIPAHKTYIQQRHVYDGQCKAAGLSNMHGLRHRYAQARYEALTGWRAPAAGGPSRQKLSASQRALDAKARSLISQELGHNRMQITSVYCGR